VDLSGEGRRLSFHPADDCHCSSIQLTIPKPRRHLIEHALAFAAGPLRAELRTLQTSKSLSSLCQLSATIGHFTCQALLPSFTGSIEAAAPALRLFAARKAGALSARVEAQKPTAEPRVRAFAEAELRAAALAHALVGICIAIPPADIGFSYDIADEISTIKAGWHDGWIQPAAAIVKGKKGGSIAVGIRAERPGLALTAKYDSICRRFRL
jgi:hypothetical protein